MLVKGQKFRILVYKSTYRNYDIRIIVMKWVEMMNSLEKLEELIKKQNGTVLSSNLDQDKIPRAYLSRLVEEGRLERVGRGVYVALDSIEDEMFAMQNKYPQLIYSHETALYLHGLSDHTPFQYSVTVPSGYKVVENVSERFKCYYIRKDLHDLGVADAKTPFGNRIKVYGMERTICDMMRSRSRIDIQIFNDALKRFVRLKSVDYMLLMEYAKVFRVERGLRDYLEVML